MNGDLSTARSGSQYCLLGKVSEGNEELKLFEEAKGVQMRKPKSEVGDWGTDLGSNNKDFSEPIKLTMKGPQELY